MSPVLASKMMGIGAGYALIATALILQSCGTYSYRNEPIDQDGTAPKAEMHHWSATYEDPEPFLGLAISGGGSRAAAFSAAVLENLDDIGILEHVSAISSVSGGSLAAAYYSLYAPKREPGKPLPREFWNDFHKAMEKDFMSAWGWRLYLPHNLILRFLTDYDRSNIMAEVFDDELFHGHTFKDLKQWNPRLFINATEVSYPSRFTFTNHMFNEMGSSLKAYPISSAVMASAAFPGLFNSVTLFDYSNRGYTHLYDGGNADNLGLDTLLQVANAYTNELKTEEIFHKIQGHETAGRDAHACLLISIDAQGDPRDAEAMQQSDTRKGSGYFIDKNIWSAIDALFHLRREETRRRFGLGNEEFYTGYDGEAAIGKVTLTSGPGQCEVWSISFYTLHSLPLHWRSHRICDERLCNHDEQLANRLSRYYSAMVNLVSHIDTNFHLSGPEGCTVRELHELLKDSAHVLVRDDVSVRRYIHEWFTLHKKNSRFAQSKPERGNPLIKELPTDGRVWGSGIADSLPLERCLK